MESLVTQPIAVLDSDGNFLKVNDQVQEIIGFSKEELIGKNFLKFNIEAPKSNILLLRNLRKMCNTNNDPYDIEIVSKDRIKKWFEVRAYKTEYNDKPAYVLAFHEVTQRRKIENTLRESEEIYRSLCEDTKVLMLNLDLKRNVTFINSYVEAFGLSKEQMVGKNILSLVRDEYKERLVFGHISAIAGKTVEQEIQINTPKGPFEVNCLANPLKKGGQIIGCRLIIQDITKRKELEKKLEEQSLHLQEMVDEKTEKIRKNEETLKQYSVHLEELVEEKTRKIRTLERMAAIGELASMVGHDLRNPLAGIRNATYILKKKQPSLMGDNGNQMLAIIDSQINHADKIINDLLDYSREINLEFEECSPKSIMDQVLTKIVIPKKIKVSCQTEGRPTICVDTDKIERVFTNIIRNAIDAMPNGGALNINSSVKGENLEFVFSDTGNGISSDIMAKIFTPLFTTKAQGMGFGLAICKRIIDAHEGKIIVKSVLNVGTIFAISLPIHQKTQFQ